MLTVKVLWFTEQKVACGAPHNEGTMLEVRILTFPWFCCIGVCLHTPFSSLFPPILLTLFVQRIYLFTCYPKLLCPFSGEEWASIKSKKLGAPVKEEEDSSLLSDVSRLEVVGKSPKKLTTGQKSPEKKLKGVDSSIPEESTYRVLLVSCFEIMTA